MTKPRDSADFIEDILLAARKAREFAADYDFAEFQEDDKTTFAVVRALENPWRSNEACIARDSG